MPTLASTWIGQSGREGKLMDGLFHILIAPKGTTKLQTRLGPGGTYPSPWVEWFIAEQQGVTFEESEPQFSIREFGFFRTEDSTIVRKVGVKRVTIVSAEADVDFIETITGVTATDINSGSPPTKIGELIKEFASPGDVKAVTLIGQFKHSGTEIHWYSDEALITYQIVSQDPHTLIANVQIKPRMRIDPVSNRPYSFERSVFPADPATYYL